MRDFRAPRGDPRTLLYSEIQWIKGTRFVVNCASYLVSFGRFLFSFTCNKKKREKERKVARSIWLFSINALSIYDDISPKYLYFQKISFREEKEFGQDSREWNFDSFRKIHQIRDPLSMIAVYDRAKTSRRKVNLEIKLREPFFFFLFSDRLT